MLFNPSWTDRINDRVDTFDLHTLIAWLEEKPSAGRYRFEDNERCPLAQYFGEAFGEPVYITPGTIWNADQSKVLGRYSGEFEFVVSGPGPRTYGAALARAHEWLAALNNRC